MRFLRLNQYESRQLSLSIAKGKFQKWMNKYISPKDFYKLKNMINNENILVKDLYKKFETIIKERYKTNVKYNEFLYLTKISYTLLLYNCLKNKNNQKLLEYINKKNEYEILKNFLETKNVSIINNDVLERMINNNKNNKNKKSKKFTVHLFAPICPDYETKTDNNGIERYTFNGLGNGVGLVGKKFLSKLPTLIEAFNIINVDLKPTILLGDFECNDTNLKRLNISNDQFLESLKSSKKIFENTYHIKSEFLASYFGGIDAWNKRINYLKKDYNFKNINSIGKYLKNIDHQKNFLSRIALYKRWQNSSDSIIDLFINQIYEYILMGNIISSYHCPSIILSSDHKAMAPYFAASFNSVPVLSLNNIY